jgi:hypothetical protein
MPGLVFLKNWNCEGGRKVAKEEIFCAFPGLAGKVHIYIFYLTGAMANERYRPRVL